MAWTYTDNMFYDQRTDRVILHTPDENFFYYSRRPPLGSGGMGQVLQGWSLRDGRIVAIKRVHDRYANIPEIRNRARLEAGMAFRHENLVEMLGIVESVTGRGPIFIISNFINGLNIDKFIENNMGRFPYPEREKRIVNLLMPILDALQYIHHYNICHLDIKPSNIMIENGRNVRLMDLGIALPKNLQMNSAHQEHNSGSGSGLMGTPKYAAPEQFGLPGYGDIGPRSDIYEFGVTLYELLSGFNPFASQSLAESVQKHQELLLPPSEKISPALLDVLRIAAHPNQTARYLDVGRLKNSLANAITEKQEDGLFKKIFKKVGF